MSASSPKRPGTVTPFPSARYEAGQPSPYHLPAPHSLSEDVELAQSSPTLRNWARHLAANSSIITAVLDSRVTNGVGPGLRYEPLVRDRAGNLDAETNARIRRVLEDWRRAPDVTGELSAAELERLCWRAWDCDGEVFLRQIVRRDGGIPYRVQVLESDMVPYSVINNGNLISGVAKDDWGRPLTYYAYRRRPELDVITLGASLTGELVELPAESVRHLKRIVRPDQTRGLTLIHAVVFRVADIAEYAQSHRLAARASADLFASINRSPDWAPTQDAEGNDVDARNWQFEHLQILDNLQAGEMVNFHAPQHPNQAAPEFLHEELRQIAAGTRSAFSQIALVFDASYAAQRLEIVHAWRMVEADRAQFISDLARPALYEAPLRWAIATGAVKVPRRVDPETLYDVRIDGPAMPVIDPVKDRDAYAKDQDYGWDSRQGIMRKMGRDPSAVDAEIAQDNWVTPEQQRQPAEPEPSEQTDEDEQ